MSKKNIVLISVLLLAALLRLWKLDQVPVSLFGDELDVGYHAYSIGLTGRDYYGNFMPLHFHSLAEWRTPLYLYSAVPTVMLFGISALGVRLPAAIFGILGVYAMYLLVKHLARKYEFKVSHEALGLSAAFFLAISPWHIQYSRAAFEVTQMLFLLLIGLYLFFISIDGKAKYLWVSAFTLLLMPWSYSTGKLFTPALLVLLFIGYFKKITSLPRRNLVTTVIVGLLIGLPLIYTIVAGGGSQRFGYIGIFSDPTTETEIGAIREQQAKFRGETGAGLEPTIIDRLYHNKFTVWGDNLLGNYVQSISTDFLFNKGDLNLRHSIDGQGMFYRIEIIGLIIGLVCFFSLKTNWRVKALVALWIIVGIIPSAITRDGGNHATRLILILPPLVFLISYGFIILYRYIPARFIYLFFLLVCFIFYQHNYWTINPWTSQRWWHYGWGEAIQSMKEIDSGYDRVFITTGDEPPWIFFAAWYQYPPSEWQTRFPIGNDIEIEGIGKVSHINKFYFGKPEGGLYDWGKVLTPNDLFVASAKDVNVNLIMEPERTPGDIKLIKSIAYPSGEPAFYLFSGADEK